MTAILEKDSNMVVKLVKIWNCYHCPHMNRLWDDKKNAEVPICEKSQRVIITKNDESIPSWCELEDAEQ